MVEAALASLIPNEEQNIPVGFRYPSQAIRENEWKYANSVGIKRVY